jgi:hypothetical protein
MPQRKVQWVAQDKDGKLVGVFTSRKRALKFCEEDVTLTKLTWNGYYHSEKPIDYDPYQEGVVSLFEPMF